MTAPNRTARQERNAQRVGAVAGVVITACVVVMILGARAGGAWWLW